MTSVPFWFLLNFLPIILSLIMFFFWKFYSAQFLTAEDFKNPDKIWVSLIGPSVNILKYLMYLQLIFIFTAKTSVEGECLFDNFFIWNVTLFLIVFIVFTLICLHIIENRWISAYESWIIINTCVWFCVIIINLYLVTNFLLFLFILELSSAIYLFFILSFFKEHPLTLIKLKNFLSTYVWVSFITLICFFTGILLVVKFNGTLTFSELWCLSNSTPSYVWQLIFIAILWKIGSPGFYFFKLELYQYLPVNSLIFFSAVSAYMGLCFLHIFFVNCWPIFVNQNLFLISYIVVYNIILLSRGLRTLTFYQFLGLSSANTWSVLLLFYLIECYELV